MLLIVFYVVLGTVEICEIEIKFFATSADCNEKGNIELDFTTFLSTKFQHSTANQFLILQNTESSHVIKIFLWMLLWIFKVSKVTFEKSFGSGSLSVALHKVTKTLSIRDM